MLDQILPNQIKHSLPIPFLAWRRKFGEIVTIALEGRQIFIASPGGLSDERRILRDIIVEHNFRYAHDAGVVFIPRDWEQISPGVGRAQSKINRELRRCDFMVMILADRWGSQPATDSRYSSGTEEEFHIALELLAEPVAAMRDLAILFKAVPVPQMADPGEQLKRVLAFKSALEQSKEIMFRVFDTETEFRSLITGVLQGWTGELGIKETRHLTLQPLGQPVSDTAQEGLTLSTEQLVGRAEQLANAGSLTQAEMLFAAAHPNASPANLLKFAKFLRRTGRLARAADINKEALSHIAVLASDNDDAIAVRVEALANLGIIERKLGKVATSRRLLEEAIVASKRGGLLSLQRMPYALDNLGITLQRLGEMDAARERFDEALELRRTSGDQPAVAQSLVNIARLLRQENNLQEATELTSQAIATLRTANDKPLLANALILMGEVLLDSGDRQGAHRPFDEALQLNEEAGNADGISIAHVQLGRLALVSGDFGTAERHAEDAYAQSLESANQEGVGVAAGLLGYVHRARGETEPATRRFHEAANLAATTGQVSREARARLELARALQEEGRIDQAMQQVQRAAVLAERATSSEIVEECGTLAQELETE